jgi:hypothetical protein
MAIYVMGFPVSQYAPLALRTSFLVTSWFQASQFPSTQTIYHNMAELLRVDSAADNTVETLAYGNPVTTIFA